MNAAASSLASTIGLQVTRRAFLRAAAATAVAPVAAAEATAAAVVVVVVVVVVVAMVLLVALVCSGAAEEEEEEEEEGTLGDVSASGVTIGSLEQDMTMLTAVSRDLLVLRRVLPPFQEAPTWGVNPKTSSDKAAMP